MATAHLVLALTVALVTIEWLFQGFPKIPFTCTYQPGKANLRVTWPKYAAIFFVYCGLLPSLAPALLASRVGYVTSVGLLVLARFWLVGRRDRQAAASGLVFDDAADPHVIVLGLEWRLPADRKELRIEERASRA